MNKLIRLINEYGHTNNCGPFQTCRIEPATKWESSYLVLSRDDNGEGDWKDWHLTISRLISKEYGFIKRLVEKNKIDLLQLDNRIALSMSIEFNKVERVLMALSISDTPIEDLISYLK